MFSAALVAAGVGLVPGLAHAADPVAPAARAVSAPQSEPAKAKAANVQTFASPADRTVRTPLPGSGAGAATARAQDASRDAYLAIDLKATAPTAHSIDLRTLVTGEPAELDITIAWGDGATDRLTASSSGSDWRNTEHKYAKVGTYTVTVTVKDTTNGVQAVNQLDFVTSGSEYTPHAPTRLLDTRAGLGAAQAKVAGRGSVVLKVAGAAKVPAGVRAVALNVTATNAAGAGHVVVQPHSYGFDEGSNLNYVAGQTVANQVVVPVGEDGSVQLINGGWDPVDLIADVTGYFTATTASGYTTLDPVRAVDTREGLGTAKGQVPGYGTFGVDIAGRGGVPKGATAVALNLTATNPRAAGHLTAYPSGQAAPATSSVNFTAGQTVANSVIVPIGPDGKITVRNGSWDRADVVADVVGYYSTDSRSALVSIGGPYRIMDTRKDSWGGRKAGPIPARTHLAVQLDGDTTNSDIDGWVLNTTVTNTTGTGFLSVAADPNTWPDYLKGTAVTPQRPVSSSLNWTAGATVSNLVQTSGGKGGMVDFWNQGWQDIDLVFDLLGWYQTV
ncbi:MULTISPECIES: PKD domain-containing protein [unclassified Streptomyces]|uniref:PKD domain-containing protein n=1 Tax=unclassified Streptomyces TaxID=2593676 RepID=UPI0034436655